MNQTTDYSDFLLLFNSPNTIELTGQIKEKYLSEVVNKQIDKNKVYFRRMLTIIGIFLFLVFIGPIVRGELKEKLASIDKESVFLIVFPIVWGLYYMFGEKKSAQFIDESPLYCSKVSGDLFSVIKHNFELDENVGHDILELHSNFLHGGKAKLSTPTGVTQKFYRVSYDKTDLLRKFIKPLFGQPPEKKANDESVYIIFRLSNGEIQVRGICDSTKYKYATAYKPLFDWYMVNHYDAEFYRNREEISRRDR